jgi:flagellar biosynthesis chaperone FliJ
MSQNEAYPLQELLGIKQNRFDQAVKVLEQKKEILEKAKKKLVEVEAARDEVLRHKMAKLEQFREELDKGTTSDKIQQSKNYLKEVEGRLSEKQRAVDAQKAQVDQAQKQVDLATNEMFQKKKDLEKLEIHKKEWEKQASYIVGQKEASEHDEQGSSSHTVRKKERKKRDE